MGVPIYIALWYAFNIGYNTYNKKSLIAYPYPWACALWQMAFGWLIFVPLWLLKVRKAPQLTVKQAVTLSPSAFGHLATHVGAVVAFFAGAVSFGHIVKASEPVVSSLLNFVFMGEVLKWPVYASLLPIIGGVGLASASEMSFNWLCSAPPWAPIWAPQRGPSTARRSWEEGTSVRTWIRQMSTPF